MTRQRQDRIAKSIVYAILFGSGEKLPHTPSLLSRFFALLTAFFTLFQLNLVRVRNDLFSSLRTTSWSLPDDTYLSSFEGASPSSILSATADMGFSGSTFFTTSDSKYIIKSVPRHFEHSFFRDEFLVPYADHMKQYPGSLLVRITEFLAVRSASLGGWLGLAPSHHIVMANLLTGKSEAEAEGYKDGDEDGDAEEGGGKTGKWETYDLKPQSYFVPERDIANGALTSEATKARLADQFDGKLNLRKEEKEDLVRQLHRDTDVLREANSVDYSLFLVRIPLLEPERNGRGTGSAVAAERSDGQDAIDTKPPPPPRGPPFTPPSPPSWLTGVPSVDGKYVYRMCVLDFFWGRHKPHAKLMGLLIGAWNIVDRNAGPMSITTTAEDYKERFMEMCEGLVEVELEE